MKYYKCPFCSGSKVKPYVRNGASQDCKDCNKDGMISEVLVKKYNIEDFVDKTTCVEVKSKNNFRMVSIPLVYP